MLAHIINGGMNSTSPVSSSIMTVRETVMRETPARKADALTMAKMAGEVPGTNWPTRRPKMEPAPRAGTMRPDGTAEIVSSASGQISRKEVTDFELPPSELSAGSLPRSHAPTSHSTSTCSSVVPAGRSNCPHRAGNPLAET